MEAKRAAILIVPRGTGFSDLLRYLPADTTLLAVHDGDFGRNSEVVLLKIHSQFLEVVQEGEAYPRLSMDDLRQLADAHWKRLQKEVRSDVNRVVGLYARRLDTQ